MSDGSTRFLSIGLSCIPASTRKYERNSPNRSSRSLVTIGSGIFFYEKLSPPGKREAFNGIYNDSA